MYGYKVDISNYFNSIDKTILLDNLKKDIDDIVRNYRVMLEDLYNKAGLM